MSKGHENMPTTFLEPGSENYEFWLKIAPLRPRLRQHVRVLPQEYRGERWYLLHDESSGRYLRFDANAHQILGRMNGDLSIQEIVERISLEDNSSQLTIEHVLVVFSKLHTEEILSGSISVGVRDALDRYQRSSRIRTWSRWSNPLAIRIPLFNPDKLLEFFTPFARPLFSTTGFCIWLCLVVIAILNAISQKDALASALSDLQFTASDALIFWLAYPVLKAFHELGHGLVIKIWGGHVNETGISLLVFVPVPYVNASSALAIRDKHRRILVSAAGILVETSIAAVAFLVWLYAAPGLLRDTALSFAILGSVSTCLYNANPLLKFDGYHILEDLIEIPDLARRSRKYWYYVIQRYLLKIQEALSPVQAEGERLWFLGYGFLSPIYRLAVLYSIAVYLMHSFHILGVLLVIWVTLTQIIKPLYYGFHFLLYSQKLQENRIRGHYTIAVISFVILAILFVPAPLSTRTQGVVWPPVEGQVLSDADGFVVQMLVASGDNVDVGQALFKLSNPVLEKQVKISTARLQEALIRESDERVQSRVRGAIAADDVSILRAEHEHLQEQLDSLVILSPKKGEFTQHAYHCLLGRYIQVGDLLGHVSAPLDQPIVRAVFKQQDAGVVGQGLHQAYVRLAANQRIEVPARLVRDFPAGTHELPSAALGVNGGGKLQTGLNDSSGRVSSSEIFQLEFLLPTVTRVAGIGERAYIRLDHGYEALWKRLTRSMRQAFLGMR